MKMVVLSTPNQYEAFAETHKSSEFQILCDNAMFYSYLDQRGISYEKLDEFTLQDKWVEVNTWGCAKAGDYLRICRKANIFGEFDLPSAYYFLFHRILIHILKNYLLAQKIVDIKKPDSVIIFHTSQKPAFPKLSGNLTLNHYLGEMCQRRCISTEEIEVSYVAESLPLFPSLYRGALKRVIETTKTLLGAIYAFRPHSQKKVDVLAHGSLRHLASTMEYLIAKGKKVGLCGFDFHKEHFLYAVRNKIPYFLVRRVGDSHRRQADLFIVRSKRSLDASLSHSEIKNLFIYKDSDFFPYIRDVVFNSVDDYLVEIGARYAKYSELLSQCRTESFLTDEDFARLGGFLVAFMRSRGIRCFCISHANLACDFKVPTTSQNFAQSITFVNSEYERDMYAAKGWDPEGIRVTGTPRYDRIVHLSQRPRPYNGRGQLKLLYCTAFFLETVHPPDYLGYLGIHIQIDKVTSLPAFQAILKMIRDFPIDLIIKPHAIEAFEIWNQFVEKMRLSDRVTVLKTRDDIATYFNSCDAMILSYWSTALIESAICKVPTIYLDLNHLNSIALDHFASQGFCRVVRSEDELREAIRLLCDAHDHKLTYDILPQTMRYYLGPFDAQNTSRVADFIIGQLDQKVSDVLPLIKKLGTEAPTTEGNHVTHGSVS